MAITNANGFRAMASLRLAAADPMIEEIEGNGMDEGRVFLHCAPGFIFAVDGCHAKSVGSVRELRSALAQVARESGGAQ